MEDGLWQRLSDVFHRHEPMETSSEAKHRSFRLAKLKAQGEWFAAIAALEQLLLSDPDRAQGLLLSGPAPILSHQELLSRFQVGVFTPEVSDFLPFSLFQLPGTAEARPAATPMMELSLLADDPLADEQFCLAFTPSFASVMVLGKDRAGLPAFQFSFDPEIAQQSWALLRSRLSFTHPHHLPSLDELVEQFTPPTPDYLLVMDFSRQLLKHLPDFPPLAARSNHCPGRTSIEKTPEQTGKTASPLKCSPRQPPARLETLPEEPWCRGETASKPLGEGELLQALTHEIRTPLTTIRTLTRLLLKKRGQFSPEVVQRLDAIDQECTEQIDRMELIFRAAELGSKTSEQKPVQLIPMSLEQVLQQSIPRWKKHAQRRNVILDVLLPNKLPQVVSDPAMLDQVLTGLMETFTRSLPAGGKIQVQVTTAGNQLKLQFLPQGTYSTNPLKSLGQLLMFQPETGSLSLNLDVTKNLFQAMGGKLIVRQRAQQGEVLTVFLPIDGNLQSFNSPSWEPREVTL